MADYDGSATEIDEEEQTPGAILARLEERLRIARDHKRDRRQAMGAIVRKRIDGAVAARSACGIERIWQEDDDFYHGVDEHNTGYTKSRSTTGGLVSNTTMTTTDGCTRFFNKTAMFVDAATARMGDILLPAGDWNFSVKKTPVPESVAAEEEQIDQDMSEGEDPDQMPGAGEDDEMPVDEKVKLGETRIKDWLTEANLHTEERLVIANSARIGTGVLKGPYPAKRVSKRVVDGSLVIETIIAPRVKSIDPINLFPDMPNCGSDIQNGEFVVERSHLTTKQLLALKGVPGYVDEEIDKVLQEGPNECNTDTYIEKHGPQQSSDRYEVWEYHGSIDIGDLDLVDDLRDEDVSEETPVKKLAAVVLVMINKTVIKGHTTPLDNRRFPYNVLVWQSRTNSPFGIGVSRQGRVGQEMVNASARALMDNAALSSGVILGMLENSVYPADKVWSLTKNKIFRIRESSGINNINQAMSVFTIPSRQQELFANIEVGIKMMEDATGVVFLLQGQQGSAPDTVGGMNLLHQNASALLRRIARVFDENITEPLIRDFYDWLLIYGEDEEKGDIMIEAIGSSSLVKREVQALQAQQVLAMAENPAYGLSKKKAAREVLRAWDFEPSKFEMDEQEVQELQQQQPPEDPRVTVANLKIQADGALAEMKRDFDAEMARMKLDLEAQKMQVDTDRDTVHVQAQTERDQSQQAYLLDKLNVERELMMLKYANDQKITLDKVKADLSNSVMKIQATKELAAMSATADKLPKPPIEPPGQAPAGQSFQK